MLQQRQKKQTAIRRAEAHPRSTEEIINGRDRCTGSLRMQSIPAISIAAARRY